VLNKWVVIFYVADCCSPWYRLKFILCLSKGHLLVLSEIYSTSDNSYGIIYLALLFYSA